MDVLIGCTLPSIVTTVLDLDGDGVVTAKYTLSDSQLLVLTS